MDAASAAASFRPEIARLLLNLASPDSHVRTHVLENIAGVLDNILQERVAKDDGCNDSDDGRLDQLMTGLLRMSCQCPFVDVAQRCSQMLHDLQEKGVHVPRRTADGPSSFLPVCKAVPISTEEMNKRLLVEIFIQTGRISHMNQIMIYHTKYLEHFLKSFQFILSGDGPLPYDYRHYLAIMAAARHRCSYLVSLQEKEFLLQGGHSDWLKGLDHIPTKLRNLCKINKLLAHQPWLISRDHIEDLLRGDDSWSLSELVHAIVILAHFHSLSSFVYGCAVNSEIDMEGGHTTRPPSLSEPQADGGQGRGDHQHHHGEGGGGGEDKQYSSNGVAVPTTSGSSLQNNHTGGHCNNLNLNELVERLHKMPEEEEPSQEEKDKRFENVEHQNIEILPETAYESEVDMSQYTKDSDFGYIDFASQAQSTKPPVFRILDYSWEDQGFSLANRLYADVGPLLDNRFRESYDMTYNTMGSEVNVDTSRLRQSIWNYVHCLYGILHDDYDYGEVNQLLDRNLKAYIKTVTCFPERTTKKDFDSFWKEFKFSEKIHVNIMVTEARMQAELLYSLRAIMRYMT